MVGHDSDARSASTDDVTSGTPPYRVLIDLDPPLLSDTLSHLLMGASEHIECATSGFGDALPDVIVVSEQGTTASAPELVVLTETVGPDVRLVEGRGAHVVHDVASLMAVVDSLQRQRRGGGG